jgi:predicted hydrolase (HD superfamily)
MIDRKQALVLINKYLKNEKIIKQSFIVEAILKKIAKILGKDEELWGLTGLLHNLDYEYTSEELEKRCSLSAQILEGLLPENCVNAIKANNYMYSDYVPSTSLDKSLIATTAVTTFIINVNNSLVSKKIHEIDVNTLVNKLNDTNFTDGLIRNRILLCADVGIDLRDFLQISLNIFKEFQK